MKKNTLIIALLMVIFISFKAFSQNQNNLIDAPGDIAFIAFHTDNGGADQEDGFSFILLDDAIDGTTITFIDEEWDGTQFSTATNEGDLIWTNNTGNMIDAGTVINITDADGDMEMASIGTVDEINAGFNLAAPEDIVAVTGTRANPGIFLTAIDGDNGFPFNSTNTGLSSAQILLITDQGLYTGPTTCNSTIGDCLIQIYDSTNNWNFGNYTHPDDVVGNFTGNAFLGDMISPTVSISLSDATLTAGETSTITFTFSEVPVGFTETDVTVQNGTLTGFTITADSTIYTAVFTPTPNIQDATNIISVGTGYTDAAGNIGIAANSDNYTINTFPSNSAPSFSIPASPNQTTLEDSGAQTVNGFASNIDDGDGNTQNLTFNVTNDNNALFSSQPAIDEVTGNLTYTPISNVSGSTIVTINLSDDGGTANGGIDTSADQTFMITINEVNDAPSFSILVSPDQTTLEDSGAQTVNGFASNIVDGDGNTQNLTFNVTNDNNALFSSQPAINEVTGNLTYTSAANVSGSTIVTINLSDDGGTSNGGIDTSADQTFMITINEVNDAPSFSILVSPDQTTLEDSGAQTVNGFASNIDDGDGNTQNLTFNVTNDNNALFSSQPAINEVTGNLTYTSAANVSGSTIVTINLSDDGGTANGGIDTSADQTFMITINEVNDAPSFSIPASPDQTILEDSGAQTVNGFASSIDDGDGNTQNLTFNVTNDNNALFSSQPAINEVTGNLTYTSAANVSGSTIVTINLSDDGGTSNGGIDTSADQTFMITINEVNDAPSFSILVSPDQTTLEDSGAQTVNGFASNIDDGDGNTQNLTFNVTNDNNALFSSQPAINEVTGNLTYTSAANVSGSTIVTINLSDDGGTANGGIDTSADQTFTITITSANDEPTVVITSTEGSPTDANPIPVTITFSESVLNFDINDILITNGSLTNFSGSDAMYTVEVIPTTTGVITLNIDANVATSASGDGNLSALEFNIIYDELLSTDEFDNDTFTIYPNPTKGNVYISVPIDKVTVFDYSGKKVLETTKNTFNLSGLESGIYIINIQTKEKQITKRVIKF
ncbi:T9SS C-terminal target domain-containing protein [Aquimarina sp. BL5]|uniref:Ig-like domain-containing protein n=1 Tax=Aquimarina sp. BL5 TaxID=1714860 RepID=UPI000E50DFF6|nr:Ig-like domain-containing protein [Aquimarina sp. BL5]AXT53548.1 T9SS C-terminal target domain-containing protein [Aquimarina sp. BL5]